MKFTDLPNRYPSVARAEHDSDGWWIVLKRGWINTVSETHAIVESTATEAIKVFRLATVQCPGVCCQEERPAPEYHDHDYYRDGSAFDCPYCQGEVKE